VLPIFTRLGITTIERPHGPDSTRLLARLEPELTLLVVDPRRQFDLALIAMVSGATSGRVLALTPEVSPAAHASALDAGADLSISESTDALHIAALIRALLRRAPTGNDPESSPAVPPRCGDLVVDLSRREVLSAGERVPLTATEFRILTVMAEHAGTVVDATEVMTAATGLTYSENEARSNLKVYIRRIRRKLEACAVSSVEIVNVRGFGYILKPLSSARPAAARAA
jgi:DNA-binding response OmpR family regulator